VTWENNWRRLSRRIESWQATAKVFLDAPQPSNNSGRPAAESIAQEAIDIIDELLRLEMPDRLRQQVSTVERRLGGLLRAPGHEYSVWYRFVSLASLRVPFDNELGVSEEPRRRLVERAFLHLNRTLTVDEQARARWTKAFRHETHCEQLGALHLLGHGIYAFKADAGSGRTDLILNEPLAVTDEVRTAETMVLTEWKRVRSKGEFAGALTDATRQMKRYARVELTGIELHRHRYAVFVSKKPLVVPLPSNEDEVTFHFMNVVIDPDRPSVEARRR
jgi:hypothetical protein